MDKFNFVRDGAMRLPPGFRFQPTDEELVFQYLKCKVFSYPLPASIIPEINLCKYDPWDLPGPLYASLGDVEQERYFFSNKETKYRNGNRINRATASGYWKATGVDRQIVSSRKNGILGMKKTLVFYRGKPPHGSRTDWIMHEYRLVNTQAIACNDSESDIPTQNLLAQMENWVICRVFMKKRSSENGEEIVNKVNINAEVAQPKFFDFMRREKSSSSSGHAFSSSSSSNSSGMTVVSSSESDREESSSCNFF